MMMSNVVIAPQPCHCGHRQQQPSAGSQPRAQGSQRPSLIVEMFEHIGHHDEVEALTVEWDSIRQRSICDVSEAARLCETDRGFVGVDREDLAAAREHWEISAGAAARL